MIFFEEQIQKSLSAKLWNKVTTEIQNQRNTPAQDLVGQVVRTRTNWLTGLGFLSSSDYGIPSIDEIDGLLQQKMPEIEAINKTTEERSKIVISLLNKYSEYTEFKKSKELVKLIRLQL
jgi:hypothetical protein